MDYTDDQIEQLYRIKLSKYINKGIEVTDELDDVLYEEAMREVLTRNNINELGRMNEIGRRKEF